MIRLKLTDEMIAEIKMGADAGAWHQARAVLDIVERELNAKFGDIYVAKIHHDPEALESDILSYEETP